jgi:hypothetical protein
MVACAIKQGDANVRLEPLNRNAQRRLRHMQSFGCTPKTALFSNGDELTELA